MSLWFLLLLTFPLLSTHKIILGSPQYPGQSSYFKVSTFNFFYSLNLTLPCNIYSHILGIQTWVFVESGSIILPTILPIFCPRVSHILESKNGMEGVEFLPIQCPFQPLGFILSCRLWTAETILVYPKFIFNYFSRCGLSMSIRCTAVRLEFQNREMRKDKTLIFVVCGVGEEFTGACIHCFNDSTASYHWDGVYPILAEAMQHYV